MRNIYIQVTKSIPSGGVLHGDCFNVFFEKFSSQVKLIRNKLFMIYRKIIHISRKYQQSFRGST